MPVPVGAPPVQVVLTVPRPERVEWPFGPTAKTSELMAASAKTVKEPSGIVFHPQRGTLFVVGDKGHVAELSREGTVLKRVRLDGLGLEGVTVGPDGRLFVIEEKKTPRIYELDLETLQPKAEYAVDTKFNGQRVLGDKKNKSAEGLTWVPEQKAFYCVNQDPPWLVKLEVPLDEKEGKAKAVAAMDLSKVVVQQASDITYDAASGHFLVLESSGGMGLGQVYEVTLEGVRVRKSTVPGVRAEGLALDGSGRAFIADDAGGVLRVEP